jgi:citrate lyase subunit beta/citryl-CoA lyase
MKTSLRRSALYMPASNARALEKARGLSADLLIFDLEDSVAPDAKGAARETVTAAIATDGYDEREVVLRLNAPSTEFWHDDLTVLSGCRPDAVLLPKVDTPEDIDRALEDLSGRTDLSDLGLWLMVETPAAILNAGAIAARRAQVPQLQGFVIGTNDLVKDTGVLPGEHRAHLLPWLMTAVAAAKAHDLAVLDGVFNDFSDLDGLAAEAAQGRALGMTGKTLIHPKQIAPANAAFSPSEEEVSQARRIVEAFDTDEAAGRGVITLDGKMVERLHLEMAQRTLERAAG